MGLSWQLVVGAVAALFGAAPHARLLSHTPPGKARWAGGLEDAAGLLCVLPKRAKGELLLELHLLGGLFNLWVLR